MALQIPCTTAAGVWVCVWMGEWEASWSTLSYSGRMSPSKCSPFTIVCISSYLRRSPWQLSSFESSCENCGVIFKWRCTILETMKYSEWAVCPSQVTFRSHRGQLSTHWLHIDRSLTSEVKVDTDWTLSSGQGVQSEWCACFARFGVFALRGKTMDLAGTKQSGADRVQRPIAKYRCFSDVFTSKGNKEFKRSPDKAFDGGKW